MGTEDRIHELEAQLNHIGREWEYDRRMLENYKQQLERERLSSTQSTQMLDSLMKRVAAIEYVSNPPKIITTMSQLRASVLDEAIAEVCRYDPMDLDDCVKCLEALKTREPQAAKALLSEGQSE